MVAVLQPVIGAHSWTSTKERLQVRPTPAPLHHRHAFFAPFFTNRLPRDHAHPSLDSPKFARHSVPMPCYRSMVGNPVISSFSPRTAGLSGADAAEKEPARRPLRSLNRTYPGHHFEHDIDADLTNTFIQRTRQATTATTTTTTTVSTGRRSGNPELEKIRGEGRARQRRKAWGRSRSDDATPGIACFFLPRATTPSPPLPLPSTRSRSGRRPRRLCPRRPRRPSRSRATKLA